MLLPLFHKLVSIFNIPLGSGHSFVYFRCLYNSKSTQNPVGDGFVVCSSSLAIVGFPLDANRLGLVNTDDV